MKWYEAFVFIVVVAVVSGFVFTLLYSFLDALEKIGHEKRMAEKRRVKRLKKLIK